MNIAWFLPDPFPGSGGHRTILMHARMLVDAGHEVHLYLEKSPDDSSALRVWESCFGPPRGEILHGGFARVDTHEMGIATVWYTAPFVQSRGFKRSMYFVQDMESMFYPAGDAYFLAQATYGLGLPAVTIGQWLSHHIRLHHRGRAFPIDFTADLSIYRRDPNIVRERRVAFIYQPDKPRRCPELGMQALAQLKKMDSSIQVSVFGSAARPLHVGFDFEWLGLLNTAELSSLYNRCSVGLCLSASNPSRIPFEMMACGLPVVEVFGENTAYDYPSMGVLRSDPSPVGIADSLLQHINSPNWGALSDICVDFMSGRNDEIARRQFLDAINSIIDWDNPRPTPQDERLPVLSETPCLPKRLPLPVLYSFPPRFEHKETFKPRSKWRRLLDKCTSFMSFFLHKN